MPLSTLFLFMLRNHWFRWLIKDLRLFTLPWKPLQLSLPLSFRCPWLHKVNICSIPLIVSPDFRINLPAKQTFVNFSVIFRNFPKSPRDVFNRARIYLIVSTSIVFEKVITILTLIKGVLLTDRQNSQTWVSTIVDEQKKICPKSL